MGEVSTIGLDIAKSVFQAHGVDGAGAVVMRKRISQKAPYGRITQHQRKIAPAVQESGAS